MSSRTPAASSCPTIGPGLQTDVARRAHGAITLDWLDKNISKRPDVIAMRGLMGRRQAIRLDQDLWMGKKDFYSGAPGDYWRSRAKDITGKTFTERKTVVEAKLADYSRNGVAHSIQDLGWSRVAHRCGIYGQVSGALLTAPLWLPVWGTWIAIKKHREHKTERRDLEMMFGPVFKRRH